MGALATQIPFIAKERHQMQVERRQHPRHTKAKRTNLARFLRAKAVIWMFVLLAQPTPSQAATTQPVAPLWHKGQLLRWSIEEVQSIQQTAFGSESTKVTQQLKRDLLLKVEQAKPLIVTIKVLRLKWSYRIGRALLSYDSAKPSGKLPPRARVPLATLGKSWRVRFDANQAIKGVDQTDALHKAIEATTRAHPVYAMLQAQGRLNMIKQNQWQYTPKQLGRLMQEWWGFLSPNKRKRRWHRRYQSTAYGMSTQETWRRHIHKGKVLHSLKGTLHTPTHGTSPMGAGATKHFAYKLKGTRQGQLILHPTFGLPVAGVIKTQISGTIEYGKSPSPPSPTSKPKQKNPTPYTIRSPFPPKRVWPLFYQSITRYSKTQ